MDKPLILVINPGSTSTKVALFAAVFDGDPVLPRGRQFVQELASENVEGQGEPGFDVASQLSSRTGGVVEFLRRQSVSVLACVAGRGGMVRPLAAGIYEVNERMANDLESCRYGAHASNLGALIARDVAREFGCPAIIADPVGVDELADTARISGYPGIERKSFSHALSIRAAARRAAATAGIRMDDASFVVAHLGGGISVAAVKNGRIIDVNNSNEGGPFTPQRAGTLPILQLIDLCFSGVFRDAESLKTELTTKAGLTAYLGTDDARQIISRIQSGDQDAERIFKAMAYQISKQIGAMAAVLRGGIDAVVLTGGLARLPLLDWIQEYTAWIGKSVVFPGELEMEALAEAAARYLAGTEEAKRY